MLLQSKYKEKKQVPKADGSGKTTVYVYSERQIQKRHKEKADRIEALRKKMSDLRTKAREDLTSKDDKTRLIALAVCLMDETYERVGNEESAEDGHYGVTTWQCDHITLSPKKAVIKYVGKSGVDHVKEVTNTKVLSALKEALKDKTGEDKLLCVGDDCNVLAKDVNEYLKPFDVTAKDIRGLHANEEMKRQLKSVREKKLPEDKKEREAILKKEFKEALEAAAEAVGHEPATLRGQYLVPGLEEAFMKDGTVLDQLNKKASNGMSLKALSALLQEADRKSQGDYPEFLAWTEEQVEPLINLLRAADTDLTGKPSHFNLAEHSDKALETLQGDKWLLQLSDGGYSRLNLYGPDYARNGIYVVFDTQLAGPQAKLRWEALVSEGTVTPTGLVKTGSKLYLNTSNAFKLKEFQRLGLSGLEMLGRDLPEPDADPLTVIRSKASQMGPNVIVEDTSLDVEGADIGVNVKWLMNTVDQHVGKRAVFRVLLGLLRNDVVEVYVGEVHGVIVSPRGAGFGFDPVFLPVGATKTLGEDKPDRYNSRALAVRRLLKGRPDMKLQPLPQWEGAWQGKVGTLSESEKEEREAERLVQPSPKIKPPRNDLRRNTPKDTEVDPDKKQDQKDRSNNYKDASVQRVLIRWATDTDKVLAVNEEGVRVWVNRETLKGPEGSKYKVLKKDDQKKKTMKPLL